MRKLATLLVTSLALAACQDNPNAPQATDDAERLVSTTAGRRIPNQYIVVFRSDAGDVETVAADVERRHGAVRRFTYRHVLRGAALQLSEEQAAELAADSRVDYLERDQEYHTMVTQSGATWGIDRIDQRGQPLSGTYTYTNTGAGVRAYIIDTGIQTNHPQFGARAMNVYDAFGGSGNDCNGHGTHVAGTVGSSTYGVAKGALLRGVRVLDCNGSGSTSGIIAALDWVRANHLKPAVANMSLGGGLSSSLNTAVNNLSNAGVFVAVAAGNENQNACNVSPASAANVTTVASSMSTDGRSSFSNWGSCVDLYAPGSSITSTWIGSGTRTISGTSMASPHVAGVAALYKDAVGDVSSSSIRSWLVNNATTNVITGNPSGTPNRLLFKSTL